MRCFQACLLICNICDHSCLVIGYLSQLRFTFSGVFVNTTVVAIVLVRCSGRVDVVCSLENGSAVEPEAAIQSAMFFCG